MTHTEVQQLLLSAQWRNSTSAAYKDHPHAYTLSKTWNRPVFNQVVQFIRDYGEVGYFFRKQFLYYRFNGYEYWTMGAPINETILINRARIKYKNPYDNVAKKYEELWDSSEHDEEEIQLINSLDIQGTVLDVGCGTGMLLEHYHVPVEQYWGIDSSSAMIDVFRDKHPSYQHKVLCCALEHFAHKQFDTILALFGTASYLDTDWERQIQGLLKVGGKAHMMFYKRGYTPRTHIELDIAPRMRTRTPEEGTEFNNYIIQTFVKEAQ